MSKITVEKRNRIFEIIAGLIFAYFSIDAFIKYFKTYVLVYNEFSWDYVKELLSFENSWILVLTFISMLFPAVIGLMIIIRKYNRLWLKIPFVITAAAGVISSSGTIIVWGYFIDDFSYLRKYLETNVIQCCVLATILELICIAVAYLTINRKIVWKSRKRLLIYTFIAVGASLFLQTVTKYASVSVIAILLPSFMQGYTEKSSKKGILGETAILITPLSPYFFKFLLNKIADPAKENMYNFFFGTDPAIDLRGENYYRCVAFITIIVTLLMPLMLFERKMEVEHEENAENGGIIKKLDSVLFKNNDESDEDGDDEFEYDDDEYEDEEYTYEDEKDDNSDD